MARDMQNPYIGPRSFRTGDKLYGRDWEVLELRDLLIAKRIVLLHSSSGAGKTSLIQASLVPAMEEENFRVLPPVRVGIDPPPEVLNANQPFNRYTLSALISLSGADANFLELCTINLADYVDQIAAQESDDPRPLVLIFDQFEEVLTVDPIDRAAKEAFFEQLDALLHNHERWVLFSMREDYVGSLEPFLHFFPTRLNARFHLELLDGDAALTAIKEPVREQGLDYAENVAENLVTDLLTLPQGKAEFVEPVQLQVISHALWEHWRENAPPGAKKITAENLETFGNVDEALREFYDTCINEAVRESHVREGQLRRWFSEKIITPAGTRGIVFKGETETAGIPNETVNVLDRLHLLRVEPRAGAEWVELTHDGFIPPILESNLDWEGVQRRARSQLLVGAIILIAVAVGILALIGVLTGRANANQDIRQQETQVAEARATNAELALLTQVALGETATRSAQVQATENAFRATEGAIRATATEQKYNELLQQATAIAFNAQATQIAAREAAQERLEMLLSESQRALANGDANLAVLLALEASQLAPNDANTYRTLASAAYEPGPRRAWRIEGASGDLSQLALGGQWAAYATLYNPAESTDRTGSLAIWDLETGEKQIELLEAVPAITTMEFLPGNAQLFLTGYHGLYLLDVASGEIRTLADNLPATLLEGAVAPDGITALVSGCAPGMGDETSCSQGWLALWDMEDGSLIREFSVLAENFISGVDIDPTGHHAVTASWDGQLAFWDIKTGEIEFAISDGLIYASAAYSPDGNTVLTGAWNSDQAVLRDAQTGSVLRELTMPEVGVVSVAFTPDSSGAVVAGRDGDLVLFDLDNGARLFEGQIDTLWRAFMSDWNDTIYTASGALVEWQRTPGNLVQRLALPTGETYIDFSQDGQRAITGTAAGTLVILDMASGQPVTEINDLGLAVIQVGFDAAGRTAFATLADGTMLHVNAASGAITGRFESKYMQIAGSGISPDGRYGMIGGCKAINAFGDCLAPGLSVVDFLAYGGAVPVEGVTFDDSTEGRITTLAFHPDGTSVVYGTTAGELVQKDLDSGDLIRRFRASDQLGIGTISSLAFDAEGKRLVSGSCEQENVTATSCTDSVIVLWDVATGTSLRRFRAARLEDAQPTVTALAFSPLAPWLVAGYADGSVTLWNWENGEEYYRFADGVEPINNVSFNPIDGSQYLVSGEQVGLWRLDSAERLTDWIENSRYVVEPGCRTREIYDLLPLCVPEGTFAGALTVGEAVTGDLEPYTGHIWELQGRAGQTISITLLDYRGGSEHDLLLRGAGGETLATGRFVGTGIWQISAFELPQDGTYQVLVYARGDAEYRLEAHDNTLVTPTPSPQPTTTPQARPIAYGETIEGEIQPYGVDIWRFQGMTGDTITINMQAAGGSALDAFVSLYSPTGVLLVVDDDSGADRDALLANYTLPQDGAYMIWAQGYQGEGGRYTLTLTNLAQTTATPSPTITPTITPTTGPSPTPAQPTQPDQTETAFEIGGVLAGQITTENPFELWPFTLETGNSVEITADGSASELNLRLTLFSPEQVALGLGTSRDDFVSTLSTNATLSGQYLLLVEPENENTGGYTLTIETSQAGGANTPQPSATAPAALPPQATPTAASTPTAQIGTNRGEVPVGGREVWQFSGQADEVLRVSVQADDPLNTRQQTRSSSLFDPVLTVYDPLGNVIAQADDIATSARTDAALVLVLPMDGDYLFDVAGFEFASGGSYTLLIERD